MNEMENFFRAAKDVALNSVPQRNADGTYKFCTGQLEILNKHIFQPLRNLFQSKYNKEQEKLKLESTVTALSSPVESEKERFEKESCALDEQLSKIDDSIEQASIKHQKFEDNLEIRYINSRPQPTTKGVPEAITKTSWRSLVFSFLFCELLTTGLLWFSMREFLSLTEVLFRSVGILVIFLNIQLATNLKKTYGNIYTYFQIFGFIMLLSAMFMGPALSVKYPVGASNDSTWDLNSSLNTLNTMSATPVFVRFYRNFPSIEAVLALLVYFSFQTFVRTKVPLEVIKESPETISPDDEIESIRQQYLLKNKRLENDKQNLLKKREIAGIQHNTNLLILLDELRKTNQKIKVLEDEFMATQIQFDTLFNELISELHSYEVEYKSNITGSDPQYNLVSWPEETDVLNYFKITKS